MKKTMIGHAGFLTGFSKPVLGSMIDVVKGLEAETGYNTILGVSEAESAMRTTRVRPTKTVCTYYGVGCSFDVWTNATFSKWSRPSGFAILQENKVSFHQPGPTVHLGNRKSVAIPVGRASTGIPEFS
jgi:hypothetical protein